MVCNWCMQSPAGDSGLDTLLVFLGGKVAGRAQCAACAFAPIAKGDIPADMPIATTGAALAELVRRALAQGAGMPAPAHIAGQAQAQAPAAPAHIAAQAPAAHNAPLTAPGQPADLPSAQPAAHNGGAHNGSQRGGKGTGVCKRCGNGINPKYALCTTCRDAAPRCADCARPQVGWNGRRNEWFDYCYGCNQNRAA